MIFKILVFIFLHNLWFLQILLLLFSFMLVSVFHVKDFLQMCDGLLFGSLLILNILAR